MKGKKIIILMIIINILLIGVICNFIKKDYLSNERIILKAMSETGNESQIETLNQSHQNYQEYISTSKIQLATAITNKGVATTSDSTFETMATNINSIVTNPSASSISYSNTSSGLTSTNVQGAIDEIDSEVNGLGESLKNSTVTVTPWNNWSIIQGTAIEKNKLVDLHLVISSSSSINNLVTVANINRRPYADLYRYPCIYRNAASGATRMGAVNITTDGMITPDETDANYHEIYLHCTFLCQ